jgi:hypothetical protein
MPFGKITLLRGKLSFVGRNGYTPVPLDDRGMEPADGEAATGQGGHRAGQWPVHRRRL